MFAIYTPNGRTFSGTLEKLRKIEKSNRLNPTKEHQNLDDLHTIVTKKYHIAPNAVEAYKKIIERPNEKSPIYHAYQIMSYPVEVLKGDHLLDVAIEKITRFPYQEFPIINNRNLLIGSLTRQTIYEYMLKNKTTYNENNRTKTLTELFLNEQSEAYSAEPVTDIRRIAALFNENKVHTIPIIENTGKIVGIISRADFIKAIIAEPPLSLWC